MYNKNSGIHKLLTLYLPFYFKNSTWLLAFCFSLVLTILITYGNTPIDFVIKIIKLGLSIFPPIFALSFSSVSFLLSLFDKDTLKEARQYKIPTPNNQNKISLYHKTVATFMFFLWIVAIVLVIFWFSNILFEINYIKSYINNYMKFLYFLIFCYNFCALLVLQTALDIVSSLYSFFILQEYLANKKDKENSSS